MCLITLKLAFVFVVNVQLISGLVSDELTLYNHLFNNGYQPQVRPVVNHSTVINVYIKYSMIALGGLDELDQVLQTVGYIDTKWTDEHLTWDPSNFSGTEKIIVKPTSVWLPDLVLEDSTKSFYDETFIRDFRVQINYTGEMRWEFGGVFTTSCDLDMSFYPFDLHNCALDFVSWMFATDTVMLHNATNYVDTQSVGANGLWTITNTYVKEATTVTSDTDGLTFSKVSFNLTLKRKPSFYLINLILPCIFVVLISLVIFWMPAESGEKVSLGITVLLSFLVFLLVIMDSTPKNSDNSPLLTTFVISIMAMSTNSVLISILVLYLHHHPTRQRPPRWIRVFFFRGLSCVLLMKKQVPTVEGRVEDSESNSGSTVTLFNEKEDKHGFVRPKTSAARRKAVKIDSNKDNIQELVGLLRKIVANMEDKENSDAVFEEWAALARIVDRVFFVISLLYICITFIYVFSSV